MLNGFLPPPPPHPQRADKVLLAGQHHVVGAEGRGGHKARGAQPRHPGRVVAVQLHGEGRGSGRWEVGGDHRSGGSKGMLSARQAGTPPSCTALRCGEPTPGLRHCRLRPRPWRTPPRAGPAETKAASPAAHREGAGGRDGSACPFARSSSELTSACTSANPNWRPPPGIAHCRACRQAAAQAGSRWCTRRRPRAPRGREPDLEAGSGCHWQTRGSTTMGGR